ncbi:MAG: multicopper oxidase domain-containing protein [Deltaproteobacteria bacterium]|nr:multicopper oxidase domain-containing protein [Deltaproteobacteria bacterium]
MKRLLFVLAAALYCMGSAATSVWALTPGLPVKEIRFLIDVSSVDKAVAAGHAQVINKTDPKTKGGIWAIGQAKKLGVKLSGQTVVYDITAVESTQDIAGVEFPVWAFVPSNKVKGDKVEGYKNPHGPVPGPTIIANEGDLVRITMRNKSKNNHTIHIHGPTVIAYDHDGTMNVAQVPVKVDQEFTYEFVASPVGTHIYHCHVNANEHMDMGLYGSIIIHSKKNEKVDQDLLAILDEWDSKFSKEEGFSPTTADQKMSVEVGHPRNIARMNLFTINGNAWTDEYPTVVAAQQGQKIRVRFVNFGSWPHNIHLHGHTLHWVAWDGRNVYPYNNKITDNDMRSDSVSLLPGERKDYIFEANQDGRWVWHCHIVPHATNDGVYHGGLLMAVVYLHPKKDGKGPYGGVLDGSGIDLDAYPLGKPVKIGDKPSDAI